MPSRLDFSAACSTGSWPGRIIGIDRSGGMLEQPASRIQREGWTNFDLVMLSASRYWSRNQRHYSVTVDHFLCPASLSLFAYPTPSGRSSVLTYGVRPPYSAQPSEQHRPIGLEGLVGNSASRADAVLIRLRPGASQAKSDNPVEKPRLLEPLL